jgi:hypothetical protein
MTSLAAGVAGLVSCAVVLVSVGSYWISKERKQAKKSPRNQRDFDFPPDREMATAARGR